MKTIRIIIFTCFAGLSLNSCQDFLEVPAQGVLTEDNLNGVKQIENEIIAAYAAIGNDEINRPLSLWNYGNVRSDDAYKGETIKMMVIFYIFEISSPSIGNETWYTDVFGTGIMLHFRANFALKLLDKISETEMPNKKLG